MDFLKTRKIFFVWGEEKEILYLEEMAQNGWLLVDVSVITYSFIKTEPGNYKYQLDFSSKPSHIYDEKKVFLKECKWHYITGQMGWHYYRGLTEDVYDSDLFTDYESVKGKYDALLKQFYVLALINIAILLNLFNPLFHSTGMRSFIASSSITLTAILAFTMHKLYGKIKQYKSNLTI